VDGSEESFLFDAVACGGESRVDNRCLVCDFFFFETVYLEGRHMRLTVVLICVYSVPVSKLPDLIYETKKDLEQVGLVSAVIGHVGDGNFHAMLLSTTNEELEIAKKAVHRIVHRAIEMDGTCSSFHSLFSSQNLAIGLILVLFISIVRYGRTRCGDGEKTVS